jgi:hypothetical protein
MQASACTLGLVSMLDTFWCLAHTVDVGRVKGDQGCAGYVALRDRVARARRPCMIEQDRPGSVRLIR